MRNKEKLPIKIVFVNMINPSNGIEKMYPPLGPCYIVSYVNKHLGKRNLRFYLINKDFEMEILRIKPDIIGISCVSQNYGLAKKLAAFIKESVLSTVLIGGCHISLYPFSLDRNIDIGVIGEGEETFLEILKIFVRKRKFTADDLFKIKGLVYWDKQTIKRTPSRPLIASLDNIPMPDRSLFRVDPNKVYMFSSRGCPYRCVFCASSRLWQKTRFHSAKYVFNEIKYLVDHYGVKRIDFYDDLFIADRNRVRKLVDLLKLSGLNKKIQFHVSGRANLIDDEICLLLKEMNVKGLNLGLESGSPTILRYLKGESVTVEDNFNAVKTVKKNGLYCMGSFIIGSPIDTKKTILETLDFIKKSSLDDATVYVLTPFPGTPVWEEAVARGLIPDDPNQIDWQKIDVEYSRAHEYSIHLCKNVSRKELYKLYRLFEREKKRILFRRAATLFFSDPERLFYVVGSIVKTKLGIRKEWN